MKKLFIPIIAFGLALNFFGCNPKSLQNAKIRLALQNQLDSLVQTDSIPGATFCVVLPDDQMIQVSSGMADKEKKITMPEDAIMFSGSVGKTFVAATVLKLVEEQKLQLDDKAITYFKDEPWFETIPNAKDFTIRMLLNHTSGVPDYVYKKELWETIKQNPDKTWTGQERLLFIADDPAVFKAGTAFSYADANYIILGMIIEKVSPKTFYELADEYFICPLKLDNTKPAIKREIEGLVSGYTGYSAEMFVPEKIAENGIYAFNPQFEWTGGGYTTSVSNLARWAKELYAGSILSASMRKEMLTPSPFVTGLYEDASYGLATFIGKTNDVEYYGHTGFAPGYSTVMEYLPSCNIGMAMQFNTDTFLPGKHKMEYLNQLKTIVMKYSGKKAQ